MNIRFINRTKEIQFLNGIYNEEGFQFVIIHGRRRVGKTLLLEQFSKEKPIIYLVAEQVERSLLLERFYKETTLNLEGHSYLFPSEDDFLNYIGKKAESGRLILIIDEFQYYVEADASILSKLQRIIDKKWKKTQLVLILCGSELRMMQELFGVQNPLHGRRTGQWKVLPFGIKDIALWFPDQHIHEIIQIYSIYGGIPAYLDFYNPEISLLENIKQSILSKGAFLYEEPLHLLKQEFREIRRYWSILEAISQNETRLIHIANRTGIDSRTLVKYLSALIATDLVEKIYPVDLKKVKTKNIQYRIADNFLSFWFRYVSPYKSQLELHNVDILVKKIENDWANYLGNKFESAVRELIQIINVSGLLPINGTKIGPWWNKKIEFDIVVINTEKIVILECKWGEKINGNAEINKLIKKIDDSKWKYFKEIWIAIISRGFTSPSKGLITINTLWGKYKKGESLTGLMIKL